MRFMGSYGPKHSSGGQRRLSLVWVDTHFADCAFHSVAFSVVFILDISKLVLTFCFIRYFMRYFQFNEAYTGLC